MVDAHKGLAYKICVRSVFNLNEHTSIFRYIQSVEEQHDTQFYVKEEEAVYGPGVDEG